MITKLLTLPVMATLLAMPTTASAQDHFTLSDLQTNSKGEHYVTVSLDGSRLYCAYNMTISLPQGMNFVPNNKGALRVSRNTKGGMYYFEYDDNDDKVYYNEIAGSIPEPGTARVICTSSTNTALTKTSGTLFDVYVAYNAWTKAGDNTVTMSGLNLTTPDAVNHLSASEINTGTITIPAEGREVTVSISADNKWGTCVLPFDHTPDGFTAYSTVRIDDGVLYLQPAQTMQAYKPYIIYAEGGYTATLTGTASAEDFPADGVAQEGALCGVLSNTQVTGGYIMQNKGEGAQFYRVGDTPFSLKAGRCYLTASQQNVRLQMRIIDDATNVTTTTRTMHSDTYYNLHGQRITTPTQHGVYIYNGKKIMK